MTKEEIREMSLEVDRLLEENEYLKDKVKILQKVIDTLEGKEEPCR